MKLTNIFSALDAWRSDFPEAFAKLDEWQHDAAIRRARMSLEKMPLSIGVMGQVKAGKSSFLNALLFGGRSLLPEAVTPKTANLTRIRYSEKASFTARFYSPNDWAQIERHASSQGTDDFSRAAREIVDSARSSGVDVAALLAQGQKKIESDSIDGLLGTLNDYVGGDGRLTALVAETELTLPLDELIGIEIVDTPGMNDPVVSRTDKTRQYMAQCDVVFFLSRASQFLDSSDQSLLASQLPQKGVKRMVLVSSQFDLAVLDDGFQRKSLQACYTRLVERLTCHAKKVILDLANLRETQSRSQSADLLRKIGDPIFSSTHAWMINEQSASQWSDGVLHTHKEINEMARDVWGVALTPQDWLKLANIESLKLELDKARGDKEKLLTQQREGLESELASACASSLNELRDLAAGRLETLKLNDLNGLEHLERKAQAQLRKVSTALEEYLRGISRKARECCTQITEEINGAAKRAARLDDRTSYKRRSHSVKVSDAIWYNPFTWFSSHFETYSETSSYSYLAVPDAVENLRFFVQSLQRQMVAAVDETIAPDTVSAGLRRELLRVIDFDKSDFNQRQLSALVSSSLSQLKLPDLNFEAPDVSQTFDGFAGEISDADAKQKLRERLESAIFQINSTLAGRLNAVVDESVKTLESVAEHLHQMLTARMSSEIQQLRVAIHDKATHIERLGSLIEAIDAIDVK